MDRKTELLSLVKDGKNDIVKASQLIDEIIFIEEQLIALRKLPFIKINPNNPIQQKPTPAFKQYKELLQQYNNSLKLFLKITGDITDEEKESPLRNWINARKELSENAVDI